MLSTIATALTAAVVIVLALHALACLVAAWRGK